MIELYLVRHGHTPGNELGRYVGTTDESLSPAGRAALRRYRCPEVEAVYASPMRRCVQTAGILWPGVPVYFIEKLRECDFGEFENKNYLERAENPAYQAGVDSGGSLPFPGGESGADFRTRCREGFVEALKEIQRTKKRRAAFVVHGGTIMSILEAYAVPRHDFYHWQVKNGKGFCTWWDETDEGGVKLYETNGFDPDPGASSGSDLR